MTNNRVERAIELARERYVAANPLSEAANKRAEESMPGGNTRSVLHFSPYPLTMVRGEGAELVDLDGHRYLDCVGEYSAGLFGHSNAAIIDAVHTALDGGVAMGAPTNYERRLADILCDRFPAIEHIRFCNSGTEANLFCLATARLMTGRNRYLGFHGAYHGSVINFPAGPAPLNTPHDFVLADFNDVEGTEKLIDEHADELAAIIVEPILGAGGNIPGSHEFMDMLRRKSREIGAVLIFDEVKTSRTGAAGMQGLLDIIPDMTSIGKFIAGGLTTGAFGGDRELMAHFNPKLAGSWNHAGTFNNNVCAMAAGTVAMGEVYTPERARDFLGRSETFRASLNEMFDEQNIPMHANGLGSIFAIHFSRVPVRRRDQISAGCLSLRPLLHMEMLLSGILICGRGDIFLSLPMTDQDLEAIRMALQSFIDRHGDLIKATIAP